MADWLNEYEKDDETEEKWAPDEATEEIEAQEDAYDEEEYEGDQEQPYDEADEYADEQYEDENAYDGGEEEAYSADETGDEQPDYGAGDDPAQLQNDEEPDESEYIMTLLDYLTEALSNPTGGGGFMSKPKVDVEGCLEIVDNIRQNIPASLEYCARTSREKERILDNAQKIAENKVDAAMNRSRKIKDDADKDAKDTIAEARAKAEQIVSAANEEARQILAKARAHAKKLVSQDEITRQAKKEASELRNHSRKEANATRRKAVEDSWRLLDALQKQVDGIALNVERRKDELLPPDED